MIYAVFVIQVFTSSLSPLPKLCAVIMPPPLPIPLQSAKNMKVAEPVAPIAASASEPTNCPTITESTRLYSCWKIFPISIGMENLIISDVGLPAVMLSTVDLVFFKLSPPYLCRSSGRWLNLRPSDDNKTIPLDDRSVLLVLSKLNRII